MIFCQIFLMTLCVAYVRPKEEKVNEEYKDCKKRKYRQKNNCTNALLMTLNILAGVMIKKPYSMNYKRL